MLSKIKKIYSDLNCQPPILFFLIFFISFYENLFKLLYNFQSQQMLKYDGKYRRLPTCSSPNFCGCISSARFQAYRE